MGNLNFLNGWVNGSSYSARRSAQSYLGMAQYATSGCGSSCGTDEAPKPSACGAGDEPVKPSACGAGDGK